MADPAFAWSESAIAHDTMSSEDAGFKAALEEARQGSREGGVPIGAALVSAQGKLLGQGHNMRIQQGSATLHVRGHSSSASSSLPGAGRDVRSRECGALARLDLPRGDHVHDAQSM